MPPSGHSGSSHASSHSSFSHSSFGLSSRSSFGSSLSSSFNSLSNSKSSGPSSHSNSSKSSSSHASAPVKSAPVSTPKPASRPSYAPSSHSESSHSSYSYTPRPEPKREPSRHYSEPVRHHVFPTPRPRFHQPVGWHHDVYGIPKIYVIHDHDYAYYPQGWTSDDGTSYRAGYYDENGNYEENIVSKDVTKVKLTCPYCDTTKVVAWEVGLDTKCDSCGANMIIEEEKPKPPVNTQANYTYKESKTDHDDFSYSRRSSSNSNVLMLLVGAAVTIFLVACIAIGIGNGVKSVVTKNESYQSPATKEVVVQQTQEIPDEIYVEPLGRYCYLDGENYYDEGTECWFWFNIDVTPGIWQYWYEGISSDYGDYGWMEYDEAEKRWYIEESADNWEPLESYYYEENAERLWHFKDANIFPTNQAGNTLSRESNDGSLYVEEIGRYCPVDGDNYYDETTQCWFWFNEDLSPAQWQYWYEDVSGDFGDFGWMEYSDSEGIWYIEVKNGVWEPLDTDKYSTDKLWHFSNAYKR